MASSANAPIQSRPYRSHRVPACIRCRSRKIRCHIDIPGEPCLSCRERRLKCQYVEHSTNSSPSEENAEGKPSKRRRLSNGNANGDSSARLHAAPVLHRPPEHPSASIILAPHVAEDVDILNRHINAQHRSVSAQGSGPYQTLSDDTNDPIVYLTVPRFRTGLRPEIGAGKEQLEIIEHIIGPFKREVIELYFKNVHWHFPLLDEETCSLLRKGPTDKIPNSVMCVVYAIGSPYWHKSDTLKMHPRPDSHFMWNNAISALQEDFLSPSLATVSSSVLDQVGRPSVSIVGNITLCGRTVSLAQTFGLHRDCSTWNITEHEKSIRLRLWWGLLITDYWSSIGYGTTPHISKRFYDVPMPTVEALTPPKATVEQKKSVTCFVHLCALTELLGEILPFVYEINPDRVALPRSVSRLKDDLKYLDSQLPEWVPLPNQTGTSNLWFCFLSMRLLLCRVTLRSAILEGDTDLERNRLDELRAASEAVLDFVLYLGEYHFLDFWLPYATHLLVHAVTVSLRCTVETQDVEVRKASVSRLERVIAHIQHARDHYDWDIANYCLERCSDSVSKIASLTKRDSQPPQTEVTTVSESNNYAQPGSVLDDASFLLSDLLDPNAFDFSWEALWDTPSGMTNFSI
ncbi:C6 transcription factor-like protein [Trematosphaeria pertusa]|uniref:C6 transcription factor-like protein n=1 Tax=Trematosphaeria pertusa TaxID=390896 RepID=A0A6A6HRX0_9PLEO|nr:C6 transcription factor-like protein [Trematosphaeria pertusa]KAF2240572.1 C6 transcription factor-like protein [Trematosphaeria pertusa]